MTIQTAEPSEAALLATRELARAEGLLAAGNYSEGFRASHSALQTGHFRPVFNVPIPRWNGEGELAGRRFLIGGEQGFGDQIMYARFAKLLQARGADVLWLCKSPLARLLTRCAGIPAITPEGGQELGDFSFFCPMSELPTHFFPPMAEPPSAAYLTPPPPVRAAGLTIGVQTSGRPTHAFDRHRSMPTEAAAELLALPGVVNLDHRETGAQDLYDTACVISGLDLVITVDTGVAHLAGAMGKPVWILLSAAYCDWRWMRYRSHTPWYPSARLIRQDKPDDWTSVIDQVKRDLRERADVL